VGSGVGSGVGGGSLGGGVGSNEGSVLGDALGLAGGQGSAARAEPDGVGTAKDGTTPPASGVGIGKQVGDGGGLQLPPTRAPQLEPYGWNPFA
jgi:hypothetical protein